jgi:hypothetical protein
MMLKQKINSNKVSSAEESLILDYFLCRELEYLEFADVKKLLELEDFASKK